MLFLFASTSFSTCGFREKLLSQGFSSDFKELVRSRTDLVELVGETLSLSPRRGGSDYVGLCPFHDDHNPSFTVYPDRQSYRCWVCDEGGDCFSFVMQTEGLDFREALRSLADRANLEMPKGNRQSSAPTAGDKNRLFEIVAWADSEFHQCLRTAPEAQRARDYLKSRGFSTETIANFHVGYHPNVWEWLLNRARGRYSAEELFSARVVRQRDGGNGYYDDFVDRVVFPIRDMRGRPVAFGGRILPDHQRPEAPKYLNSVECELFKKSSILFGFDSARDAIRRSQTAIVVEGYTDCIMAHQYGVTNVVCTMGTSLTEQHVIGLKRIAGNVVQCFDGDEAGQKAAERSLKQFVSHDVDLRVLTLPDGIDPADFLKDSGPEAFRKRVEEAPELWEYKLKLTFDRFGFESIEARRRVLEEMVNLLAEAPRLAGTEREDMILGRLAHRVGIDERSVREKLSQAKRANSKQSQTVYRPDNTTEFRTDPIVSEKQNRYDRVESEILEIIFAVPKTIEIIRQEINPDDFQNEQRKILLKLCIELAMQGTEPSYEQVTAAVESVPLKRAAAGILDSMRTKEIDKTLRDEESSQNDGAQAGLLREAIDNLKWRKKEELNEANKGRNAQRSAMTGVLDSEDKNLLRHAADFHAMRVKKKSLT